MTNQNLTNPGINSFKPYIFLVLFAVLGSLNSYGQRHDKKNLFVAVFFGDFFKNDTVDVIIDDSLVLKNAILTSSLADGSANTEIYVYRYENNSFFIKVQHKDVLPFKNLKEKMEIVIVLNNKKFKFQIDIKKGRYIAFAKNDDIIFTEQSFKLPVFD